MKKILFGAVMMLCMFQTAYADVCDSKIRSDSSEYGYRKRGNRCEGLYISNISAGSLEVVGLTHGKFDFRLDKNEIIEVSSPDVRREAVHIRSVGVLLTQYYRMDGEIPPRGKLTWPVKDVLYPRKLSADDIGIFGYFERGREKIYVPVSAAVKPDNSQCTENKTNLYLQASDKNLNNVEWQFYEVVKDNCNKADRFKINKSPNKRYRMGEIIEIPIEVSAEKDKEICVEVRVQEESSSKWIKGSNIRIRLKD